MKDETEVTSQKKKRVALIAIAAIVFVCLTLIGVGVASGWFTSGGLFQTTQEQQVVSEDDGANKSPSSDTADTASSSDGDGDTADTQPEQQTEATEPTDGSGSSDDSSQSGSAPAVTTPTTPPASGSGSTGGNSGGNANGSSSSSDKTEGSKNDKNKDKNDSADKNSSTPSTPSTPKPDPKPAPEPEPKPDPKPEPQKITVSVNVDSSRAKSYGYPSSLASKSVTLSPGASVYDALVATGVSVGGSSSYVRSIGGLAEFACGAKSGWLYYVNGSSPGFGCGSYLLYGGERITWIYTLDMGNDI